MFVSLVNCVGYKPYALNRMQTLQAEMQLREAEAARRTEEIEAISSTTAATTLLPSSFLSLSSPIDAQSN